MFTNNTTWLDLTFDYHEENNTSSNNLSNSSTTAEEGHELSTLRNVVTCLLLGSIGLCTMVGNTLVIVSVWHNRRLRTVTNFFVVSLATSDLLVSILVMPLSVTVEITGKWTFGFALCDFWISSDVMLCTASILNLCCISLDRYFAITKPLQYAIRRNSKRAGLMIAVVWFVSIVITLPPIFGWKEKDRYSNAEQCMLTQDPGYIIYSSMGSFYVPLLVMLFVYGRIFKVAYQREKKLRPYRASFSMRKYSFKSRNTEASLYESNSYEQKEKDAVAKETKVRGHYICRNTLSAPAIGEPASMTYIGELHKSSSETANDCLIASRESRTYKFRIRPSLANLRHIHPRDEKNREKALLKKECKAAKTLAIVIGCFVLCWLPFFLVYLIAPFCPSCSFHPTLISFITWLGYFNSALNPLIYALYSRDFRHTFWKLTLGRCCRKRMKT